MKPDPRFPNRPRHPDFDRLSSVLVENDDMAELGMAEKVFDTVVDFASVIYAADQRVRMASSLPPFPGFVIAQQAAWVDGFTAGVRFQQAGGHVDPA